MISNKAISTILTTPIYQSHNVSRGVICIHQRAKGGNALCLFSFSVYNYTTLFNKIQANKTNFCK